MQQPQVDEATRRANARLAILLGIVAVVFYFAIMVLNG